MAGKDPWEMSPAEVNAAAVSADDFAVPEEAPTVEEMHPAIPAWERVFLKQLANSPLAQVNYLKQKYPDLEVRHDSDGNVLIRKEGEPNFRTLDPQTGFSPFANPKEALLDIADAGVDVVNAGLSSAATAAGGLFGGISTLGVGALPSAALAGGATSAALEGARQKLGQALGIPQEVSKTDMAIAGGGGMLAPFLFGTGATGGQVAKTAIKEGLDELGTKALQLAQRGGLGRAYDKFGQGLLPAAGELVSGIPGVQILTKALRGKDVEDIKNMGALTKGREVFEKIKGYFGDKKAAIGAEMNALADESDAVVDISSAREVIMQAKDAAQKLYDEFPNEANAASLRNLDQLISEHFVNKKALQEAADEGGKIVFDPIMGAITEVPNKPEKYLSPVVSLKQALRLKDSLTESADMFAPSMGKLGGRLKGSKDDKTLVLKATDAVDKLRSAIDVAEPKMAPLNTRYADVANKQKLLNPEFRTAKSTTKTLQTLNDDKDLVPILKEIDQEGGTGILDSALLLKTAKSFNRHKDAISSGSTTSTSRSVPLGIAGASAGSALGFGLGLKAFGGNPYITSALMGTLGGAGGFVGSKAGSPAAIETYINLAKGANLPVKALRKSGLGLGTMGEYFTQDMAAPAAWDLVAKREGIGK